MASKHKVMAVTEFGKPLELVERALPEVTADEVLIKTTFAGLCHSDLHQIDGYFGTKEMPIKLGHKRPFCIGHEIEGVVIAAGPGAKGKVSVGDHVAVYPWGGCQRCQECTVGDQNLCSQKHANDIGNGKNMFGGFSSHVVIPTYKYCFDKSGIPDGLAAIYMCSGLTAYSALKKIGSPANGARDVLILGLGGVGMQGFEMAKAMFGSVPMAADIREEALDTVRAQGGLAFNPMDKDCIMQIRKASSDGNGIAAVIDFVGSDKTFALSQSVLRRGGQAIQVGLLGGTIKMPLAMVIFKSVKIQGTLTGSLSECAEMLDLIRGGGVAPIPHHFRPLSEINQAVDDLRAGKITGRCIFKHDWVGSDSSL